MRRRDFLAATAAAAFATPAAVRPVMPLHRTARDLLSPPFDAAKAPADAPGTTRD